MLARYIKLILVQLKVLAQRFLIDEPERARSENSYAQQQYHEAGYEFHQGIQDGTRGGERQ